MWRLYCDTDSYGNIIDSYYGKDISASDPFTFFFLIDEDVALNIDKYRVDIVNFKTSLVLKPE